MSLGISVKNFVFFLAIFPIFNGFASHGKSLLPNDTPKKNQDYLISSPDGWRGKLAEKGFTIATDYLQYVLGNPIGQKRAIVHTEQFSADFNWNLEKAYGIPGLELHLGMLIVSGKNLETATGSTFPLTLLYGGRTFLVNNLYLKQTSTDGKIAFKVGRIQSGDDFLTSPLHLKFLSLAFDAQIAMYINTPASGYPYATWGAFFSSNVSNFIQLNFGVYKANKASFQNKYHGLDLSFDSQGGAEFIFESVYKINQHPFSRGLASTFKLGAFYFSGTTNRFITGDRNGNYGAYFSYDQKIYRPHHQLKSRGLSSFLTLLFFPKDRNTFEFYTTAGLVYEGLFSSRPKDTTAFAIARGSYSSVLRSQQRVAQEGNATGPYGNQPQTYEMLLELNHWFYIKPWFNVTPAVQYVIKPQGMKTANAFIMNLQIDTRF